MRSRPIKVLHVLHAFSHGGLENGIVNIINGSPPDLEHELCLLTTAGEFLNRLQKPVRYYELRKKPGNSLGTILQIRRIIRESGANIVHTRNWGAFDGVIAACLCPGVTVLHGEHGRDMLDPQGMSRRRNLMRRILGFRIERFTTVSEDLVQWLREKIGILDSKITLIRNGVDTERFRPQRDPELRRELGIDDVEFVIGTIGRLDRVKNHAGLIEAFASCVKEIEGIRLVIVGDGPEWSRLESLIRIHNLSDRAIVTGYRNDVERFYGIFDIFVLNSFAEGMSNTVLEAMSSGLPVICTAVGANPDLIKDGDRGKVIPPGNENSLAKGLCEYYRSPGLRHNAGTRARVFVKESYSLPTMIRQYYELYRSF